MKRQSLTVDRSDVNTVRANACYHTATTLATIAVTTMDKAIQAESESMRAKRMLIHRERNKERK